jgi:hypothetical protein
VSEKRVEGRLILGVVDYGEMREVVAELLAAVRTIRSAGQTERAAELTALGVAPPTGWRESARRAWTRSELPWIVGFVYQPISGSGKGSRSGSAARSEASESLVDAQISSITEAYE